MTAEDEFKEASMREKVQSRKSGRVAGALWASNAAIERCERVLAYAAQEVLDRWIDDDERTAAEAKHGGEAADDVLIEVQTMQFVAINGATASVADDRAAAYCFWDELNEEVEGPGPSDFWLSFYVGFVESVNGAQGKGPRKNALSRGPVG
jgi:hypothetical protein